MTSLFIKNRIVRLAPTLCVAVVIALMLQVVMSGLEGDYFTRARADLGFWLAVLAEIVFIIGFAS